ESNPAIGYSHPEWLCKRWEQRFGRDQTKKLLEWNNSSPVTYARLNSIKGNSESLRRAWAEEGVEYESANFAWAPVNASYKLLKHPPLAEMKSFTDGLFYIQDPSTL